jgi:hypothetical protein
VSFDRCKLVLRLELRVHQRSFGATLEILAAESIVFILFAFRELLEGDRGVRVWIDLVPEVTR